MNIPIQLVTLQNLSLWGSLASIASLVGVLYNNRRLSKMSRLIDREHERIVDAIKPFDLYYKIRAAMKLLQSRESALSASPDARPYDPQILEALSGSVECLHFYFCEVHGLMDHRENLFLDAAHAYLRKNNPDKALEYYKRALLQAEEGNGNRIECLYGLRSCFARKGDSHACAIIDRKLRELRFQAEKIGLSDQMRGYLAMILIKIQAGLRLGRIARPGDWDARYGDLHKLITPDSGNGDR